MTNEIGYDYSDIYLIPRHGVVNSRSECNVTVKLGSRKFKIPVVPANMRTVVDIDTCKYLAKQDIFYIMHRFDVDVVKFCREMTLSGLFTSISVGVGKDSRSDITKLYSENIFPDYITIDIAHGDADNMIEMIKFIKTVFPKTFLIAGNVVTPGGVERLCKAGADAVKVGIGQGLACTTKDATGFTVPQFTAVMNCAMSVKVPIIADGGIRCIGDISKAIVAGADIVMAGSLFSGYSQSSKNSRLPSGRIVYYGSASAENKGSQKNVEGRCIEMEDKGTMDNLILSIEDGLKSAVSYSGGKDLTSLYSVKYGILHK